MPKSTTQTSLPADVGNAPCSPRPTRSRRAPKRFDLTDGARASTMARDHLRGEEALSPTKKKHACVRYAQSEHGPKEASAPMPSTDHVGRFPEPSHHENQDSFTIDAASHPPPFLGESHEADSPVAKGFPADGLTLHRDSNEVEGIVDDFPVDVHPMPSESHEGDDAVATNATPVVPRALLCSPLASDQDCSTTLKPPTNENQNTTIEVATPVRATTSGLSPLPPSSPPSSSQEGDSAAEDPPANKNQIMPFKVGPPVGMPRQYTLPSPLPRSSPPSSQGDEESTPKQSHGSQKIRPRPRQAHPSKMTLEEVEEYYYDGDGSTDARGEFYSGDESATSHGHHVDGNTADDEEAQEELEDPQEEGEDSGSSDEYQASDQERDSDQDSDREELVPSSAPRQRSEKKRTRRGLKTGPMSNTEYAEVHVFSDEVKAMASSVAKRIGKTPRDVLVAAGLGIKPSRSSQNPCNVYCSWYWATQEKPADCNRVEYNKVITDEYNKLMEGIPKEDIDARKAKIQFVYDWMKTGGQSTLPALGTKSVATWVSQAKTQFCGLAETWANSEDIEVVGAVMYVGNDPAARTTSGIFAGSSVAVEYVEKNLLDIRAMLGKYTAVFKCLRDGHEDVVPSMSSELIRELKIAFGENDRDRNRRVIHVMIHIKASEALHRRYGGDWQQRTGELKNIHWKKFLAFATKHRIYVSNWPPNVLPPGPGYGSKAHTPANLRHLVHPWLKRVMGTYCDIPEDSEGEGDHAQDLIEAPEVQIEVWPQDKLDMNENDPLFHSIPLVTSVAGMVLRAVQDCPEWQKKQVEAENKRQKVAAARPKKGVQRVQGDGVEPPRDIITAAPPVEGAVRQKRPQAERESDPRPASRRRLGGHLHPGQPAQVLLPPVAGMRSVGQASSMPPRHTVAPPNFPRRAPVETQNHLGMHRPSRVRPQTSQLVQPGPSSFPRQPPSDIHARTAEPTYLYYPPITNPAPYPWGQGYFNPPIPVCAPGVYEVVEEGREPEYEDYWPECEEE